MSTSRRFALGLFAALTCAQAALAQKVETPAVVPLAPKADKAASAAEGPAARVRASHRVDVIAPGERVETVIDRMRKSSAPAAATEGKGPDRPPVRGPDGARGPDRPGSQDQRGPPGSRPSPGGPGSPADRPHR